MASITSQEFDTFSRLIRDLTGIALEASKSYLIENRLEPLLKAYSCSSFSELYYKAKNDSSGELKRGIIDRITTQETSFFRDQAPFEMLKFKILPDLIDARKRTAAPTGKVTIRIWSAACATGQEIYSIAIALKETLVDLSRYNLRIVGTDISDAAIAKASLGEYSRLEWERGMPPEQLARHFKKSGEFFKVNDEIRSLVTFRRLNLLEDFEPLGRWDIVFCRNVAIYFSDEDKKHLFERIGRVMESDSALIIGSTESLLGICSGFESNRYLRSIYYGKIKPGDPAN
jgi:chemotaxis protein methyltransferase CheR